MLLRLLQFADCMAGAGDVSLVACGRLREGIVDMNAAQPVFLFQIEVTMDGDFAMIVLSQQRQQSLGIHRRGSWLIQMQILQSLLKEVG